MKTNDAYNVFGFKDRVLDMFLMANMQHVSSFCREMLMQGKFYNLPVDKLANFLARELTWQDEVYKSYGDHLANCRQSPNFFIEQTAQTIID